VLPIQVGLVFFGAPFLARWVGPEFIDGSYPALVALSCGLTLAMMQSVAARMLYGLGRLRWFARIGLLEAALNVGLLYLMVKPLGVAGAAIAVMVPNVLACTAVILYTLRVVQLSCMSYVRLWIAPLVCTGLCGVVWWFVGQPGADYGQILATACAGLVPYLMAVAAIEGFLQMLFTRLIKRLQQQYGNAVPTKMPR
jgi:O-antigen/teichoic acid export membrane protein